MASFSTYPDCGGRRPCRTLAEALREATIDALDARVLLQHVLGVEHAYLISHAEQALSAQQEIDYAQLVACRQVGEPVAYLIGWREFYGRRFRVGPAVLIPRPETELLVDLALERIPSTHRASVADLGTGSGSIAVTLALERPQIEVLATDNSAAALSIAAANACALAAPGVRLSLGDWFAPLGDRMFDLIVSNPPYVAEGDPHLSRGDVRFEPRSALLGGAEGLDCIRAILAGARSRLRPQGWLLLEHGHEQGDAVRDLLENAGYRDVFVARDLAGLTRVSGGRGSG